MDALLPRYLIDLPPSAAPSTEFLDEAFGRSAPLALEIGFGNGTALVALAQAHPNWNCIGVDVYRPGFGALMLACEREEVRNVRIVDSNALDLLERLPDASLRQIDVFFPDPWPKARHHKRRLVDAAFAAQAAACLATGSRIRLATDAADYAEQMQQVLDAEQTLAGGVSPRPPERPVTPFEAKALAQGRSIVDLAYCKAASA